MVWIVNMLQVKADALEHKLKRDINVKGQCLFFLFFFYRWSRNTLLNKVASWTKTSKISPPYSPLAEPWHTSEGRFLPVFALFSNLLPSIWRGLMVYKDTIFILGVQSSQYYNVSVLGLDSGYTVKYTPTSEEVPSGFTLGNSFRRRGIFDRISQVES